MIRCPTCGDKSWQCDRCKRSMEAYKKRLQFPSSDILLKAVQAHLQELQERVHQVVPVKPRGGLRR